MKQPARPSRVEEICLGLSARRGVSPTAMREATNRLTQRDLHLLAARTDLEAQRRGTEESPT